VVVLTLLVFAVLSTACWLMYDHSEDSLLEERTSEAGTVLTVSVVGNFRAPLDAAATVAAITDGDPASFAEAIENSVGSEAAFDWAALYRVGTDAPLASIGEIPSDVTPPSVDSLLAAVQAAQADPNVGAFIVVDLLDDGRRLGYAVADGPQPEYIVYADNALSTNPNERRQTSEPFAQLDYAIYLNEEQPEQLLGSSLPNDDLPIDGRRESSTVPFGDQELLLVMTPIGQMSGWLFANLWWIVGLLGIGLALAAGWLTRRLHQRSEEALSLADENARLYDEQRHIAETLQLSLLPQELIPPPGGSVAARYWPAGEASLIGGDFYDAFRVRDDRWAIVIGDVCGKGIDAAAITGLVRHTLRASARNSDSPSEVLLDAHRALADHQPSTFCTVCFIYVTVTDDGRQLVTLSLGGHPSPLLRRADGSVAEIGQPGSLIGLFDPVLTDATVEVTPGDTLVLYTDGLTDAPQDQAVPLQELIDLLADEGDEPVELLADSIRPLKRRRRPRGSADDTAVVVVRIGAGATPVTQARETAGRRSASV
jgi:serine phosphatase RsbU (regulator of sigma subunit)